MKKPPLWSLALLLIGALFVQESRAQDYTRWGLPDGALARLGKGRIGLSERSVAYSPDGTRIAVASGIGIWLYDAATKAEVSLLLGHAWPVSSVSFSLDGQTLASGSYDKTIRLWDVESGQELATLRGHTSWVNTVAYSPDGRILASGSDTPIGRARLRFGYGMWPARRS